MKTKIFLFCIFFKCNGLCLLEFKEINGNIQNSGNNENYWSLCVQVLCQTRQYVENFK